MSLTFFREILEESPLVKRDNYLYFINPITDGIPEVKPILLEELISEMHKRIVKCGEIDKIVTLESMGIPLTVGLSLKMKIPFVIIRKRSYGLPDEVVVDQVTGYSKSKFYINGIKKDDRVIIVDDVLSTGSSLKAVLNVFKKIGVDVKGVFVAVDRGDAAVKIKDEFNIGVDVLVKVKITDGKVVVNNL